MKRATSASPQATKKPRLDNVEVDKEKATLELHQHQYQYQNRYQHLNPNPNPISNLDTNHNQQSAAATASEEIIVDDMSPTKVIAPFSSFVADGSANGADGWTKVEKRKMKKVRNLDLKMSVCQIDVAYLAPGEFTLFVE